MSNKEYYERIRKYSDIKVDDLYADMGISDNGLTKKEVEYFRKIYGENNFIEDKTNTTLYRVLRSFINPFNSILFFLVVISCISNISLHSYSMKNSATTIILFFMIAISGFIRLPQELHAKNTIKNLKKLVKETVTVCRDGKISEVLAEELVVGDKVFFSAGEKLPADVRITRANDLFISQATITGESELLEKDSINFIKNNDLAITDYSNIAFMGTTIVSGTLQGIVIGVGKETLYGNMSNKSIYSIKLFQKRANDITWVMLKFMFVLIPIVFIALGITKGNWIKSLLFAVSISFGLVPEMLPMVVTTCLTKGSISMQKNQTFVKDISVMQSFGSMDILCMDKTGTLTNESILLEYYMDILGNESSKVLDYAYLNSSYNFGIRNPIDSAILACDTMPKKEFYYKNLLENYQKLDDLPFDYNRKFISVLVNDIDKKEYQIITKGDIKNVISRCSYFEYNNKILPINKDMYDSVKVVVDEMLNYGMKVIAIARKTTLNSQLHYDDEREMILIGYLAFFDSPKSTAKLSIESLKNLNIIPKVLTGDHVSVAKSICTRVGIDSFKVFTGNEINDISDAELSDIVEKNNIFAELTPEQKSRIVKCIKDNGHVVGFLGDGINDISALNEANIGISVDTAIDVAKDASDVVLLQNDLNILNKAIIEGRKTFTNMLKYIKITASSNFGNILSIVCASVFLPFFPMMSIQILMLNLLYDALCIVIPWDNVDNIDLIKPKAWSAKRLTSFMLTFGPISSLFDIITFIFLYYILCPSITGNTFFNITDINLQTKYIAIFNTGWFLESMWTQVLILHFLRTKKLPFIQSRPSRPVIIITIFGIIFFTAMTFTKFASIIGLTKLPIVYFVFLLLVVIMYTLFTTIVKYFYQRKNNELI